MTITARALFANGRAGPASTATVVPIPAQPSHYVAAPAPLRLYDTRLLALPPPAPGGTVNVFVAGGLQGAPTNATAVVLNVTATTSIGSGFVTAYPTGSTRPNVSNLNIETAGQTIAATVFVAPGEGGNVTLFTQGGGSLIVDLVGWFEPGAAGIGRFVATGPERLVDTRSPSGGGALAVGATRVIAVTGQAGLPETGVSAVVLNLTATQFQPGYLRVWPSGAAPETSNLNVDRAT